MDSLSVQSFPSETLNKRANALTLPGRFNGQPRNLHRGKLMQAGLVLKKLGFFGLI